MAVEGRKYVNIFGVQMPFSLQNWTNFVSNCRVRHWIWITEDGWDPFCARTQNHCLYGYRKGRGVRSMTWQKGRKTLNGGLVRVSAFRLQGLGPHNAPPQDGASERRHWMIWFNVYVSGVPAFEFLPVLHSCSNGNRFFIIPRSLFLIWLSDTVMWKPKPEGFVTWLMVVETGVNICLRSKYHIKDKLSQKNTENRVWYGLWSLHLIPSLLRYCTLPSNIAITTRSVWQKSNKLLTITFQSWRKYAYIEADLIAIHFSVFSTNQNSTGQLRFFAFSCVCVYYCLVTNPSY